MVTPRPKPFHCPRERGEVVDVVLVRAGFLHGSAR
jgi:hypothetical protein